MKSNELTGDFNPPVSALFQWLEENKISFIALENEVVEIEDFGKMFVADTDTIQCIFKGSEDNAEFNLMETPQTLIDEGIYYVAFAFGDRWYYYDLREDFQFNILKYVGKREMPKMDIPFVNLGVHSPFELLNGSGDLSLWVKKAKVLGQTALGICDRNTMAGTLALQKECAKAGIKPVFGYSLTMKHEDVRVDMKVYCQSKKGLQNLLRIQKAVMVDSVDNIIDYENLLLYGEGNVLVFGKLMAEWMRDNMDIVYRLQNAFNCIYYQFDPTEYKAERIDIKVLNACETFMRHFYNDNDEFTIQPVLICDNYYQDKDDAKNKIILNKIASGAAHEQSDEQYFKDMDELYAMFQNMFDAGKWDIEKLFRLMCNNTVEIAQKAEAGYELGQMYMPRYMMREDEKRKYGTRRKMFLELLDEGLERLVPKEKHTEYRNRLEEEVYIIESTNNLDYFLIQWDMIQEAKRRGIATGVGRGSAGGSLVSYLLGIISIDPIKYDLLFSRFLVPERCGLNWLNNTTIIGEDIWVKAGDTVIELTIDNKRILFFNDAEFRVKRGDKEMTVYADEVKPGDEIIFDNRDLLWTLGELTSKQVNK